MKKDSRLSGVNPFLEETKIYKIYNKMCRCKHHKKEYLWRGTDGIMRYK